MKTLIELFDTEPIYNYLAATVFKPQKVCFIGDYESLDIDAVSAAKKYASLTGLDCTFSFVAADSNDFDEMRRKLGEVIRREKEAGNECTVDVTGGRDLALVAAGSLIPEGTKVVFYDRKENVFRFLGSEETRQVNVSLTCEAFITIAGGAIYSSSRNADFDENDWQIIRNVVRAYFENREVWNRFVKYLQQVSKGVSEKDSVNLEVNAPFYFEDINGKSFTCNESVMRELERTGAIKNLDFPQNRKRVSFRYASAELANLLVNEGVWLELAVYLAAMQSDKFDDVQTSVKFVWDIPNRNESLSGIVADSTPRNEVDVVMTRGVLPVFISCKTRVPTNDDLNEIYAIKKKFGGDLAIGMVATTKYVGREFPVRERAEEMGIYIIDERYFENGTITKRLERITELK
jgi:hypothetical protein